MRNWTKKKVVRLFGLTPRCLCCNSYKNIRYDGIPHSNRWIVEVKKSIRLNCRTSFKRKVSIGSEQHQTLNQTFPWHVFSMYSGRIVQSWFPFIIFIWRNHNLINPIAQFSNNISLHSNRHRRYDLTYFGWLWWLFCFVADIFYFCLMFLGLKSNLFSFLLFFQ